MAWAYEHTKPDRGLWLDRERAFVVCRPPERAGHQRVILLPPCSPSHPQQLVPHRVLECDQGDRREHGRGRDLFHRRGAVEPGVCVELLVGLVCGVWLA